MDDIGFFFNHQDRIYQLPVNPEDLEVKYPGNNTSKVMVASGEILLLQKRKLVGLTISSWLPERNVYTGLRTSGDFLPAVVYDELFRGVLETEDYMRLIVTGINLNMLVAIQSYTSTHQAGDHEDIYFDLELKEFKPVEALQVPITSENVAITQRNVFSLGSGGTGSSSDAFSVPTQITVGSLVTVTGELHVSSAFSENDVLIGNATKNLRNFPGRVSHIIGGAQYPYHITDATGKWLGWVSKSAVKLR